jgi:site-specific DNA-methyltransferase (adenine-specific)
MRNDLRTWFAVTPYYADDAVTIYHGDCRDVLGSLPATSLLLTDPPYGIPAGAAVWRRNGTAIEDWGEEGHNVTVTDWRQMAVLRDAWIVEFGLRAGDHAAMVAEHVAVGWVPCNFFALVKQAPPPTPRPMFANAIEMAVVSRSGHPEWHGTGYVPNRWIGMTANRLGTGMGHPTEKPVTMLVGLVAALCGVDGLVLDPFMGSGTTLRAAKDLGRKAIGIEVDEQYCEMAARRCAQDVLDFGGAA